MHEVVQLLIPVWLFVTPWTAGFPVLYYLLEVAQTHVHWVGDAIPPSHLLMHEVDTIITPTVQIRKVSLSSVHSVAQLCPTNSLWPHEPQHARPPCPSPTPGVHPNPCPSSRWCHPTISSSVIPFSSCLQSFPASVSFPMSQLFASDGQSIRDPASASVLPVNTQDWSPLGWTGWICLQPEGLSRVFSNTTVQKHQFFSAQLSL